MINPFIGSASKSRIGISVFGLSVVTFAVIGAFFICGRSMRAAPRLPNGGNTAAKVPAAKPGDSDTLCKTDLAEVEALYKQLTDAENAHDSAAVERLVWKSPNALLVSKTATAGEGNWAGVWGDQVVVQHLHDLLQGTFHLDSNYLRLRVVGISRDVAETYAPVQISVSFGGQAPVPKPFLIITDWVKTDEGWRMATDIALPVPPSPNERSQQ
jgi:hypothetical protein